MINTNKTINLSEVAQTAGQYYKDGDFYCSEALMKTIKDTFEIDMPDEIIAMTSGFPQGIGASGCTCGALSGGVMALGMIFGRTKPKGPEVTKAMELSKELHDKFRTLNKVACCRILIKKVEYASEAHVQQCAKFTGEMTYETAKIICREKNIPFVE